MLFKHFTLLLGCVAVLSSVSAQNPVIGVDFTTRFDNREYSDNTFNDPQTLFSARLSPHAGVEWMEKNRLMVGVDLMQNFGQQNVFISDVKPLLYYQFKTNHVQANAGIFDRKELIGDYSRAFFSDSTVFYHNRFSGFLGRYQSTERKNTYVEMALDWEGMYSVESREMFRIISGGRYTLNNGLYFGYAFSMFHFAGSIGNENVTDNLLVNPYLGWNFNAFFNFNVKTSFLFAPQRARSVDHVWRKPCGGQLDFTMTRWGVKLENNLYLGENLQPFYNTYAGEHLYAGERFYSTTEHVYNRTFIGYDQHFFNNTLGVEGGMIFQYDGTGVGTQQVVKLSVNLECLINLCHKSKNNQTMQ